MYRGEELTDSSSASLASSKPRAGGGVAARDSDSNEIGEAADEVLAKSGFAIATGVDELAAGEKEAIAIAGGAHAEAKGFSPGIRGTSDGRLAIQSRFLRLLVTGVRW